MANNFKHAAVMGCMRTLLLTVNLLIWSTGFVFLVVGIWGELDLPKYMELSPEFSGTAPYVLIGIAVLIVLVTLIAFYIIINGQPVLLYIYGGFLACIFMMNVGVGAATACYRDTFAKSLHDGLTQTITSNHADINFDFAQTNLRCCGVSNYTDWIRLSPQKVIPISCCFDPNDCVTANYSDVFQQGCYAVISEYMEHNIDLLVGVALGSALLPFGGALLSCFLASYTKKRSYNMVN